MAAPDSSSNTTAATEPAPNSIRPSEPKRKLTKAQAPEASSPPQTAASPRAVPEEIARRFVQVKNKYYFPDGALGFTDRGNRITTTSENTEVVRSLVDIAKARSWQEITVRGTERFRKEVWIAASVAGLQVRGYKPTEFEQSHLVRSLARDKSAPTEPAAYSPGADADSISRGAVGEDAPVRPNSRAAGADRGGLVVGKLVDHDRATYQHDPRAAMSYFVKLETARGDRVIWGVDLERALKESLTKPEPGDEVGVRSVRQDAVTVKTATRDAEGQVTGEQNLNTHRNRWVIEKREFFEARAAAAQRVRDTNVPAKEAVRQHPELVGTYLQVHAAELAARRFRDPEDRALFVAKVRAALAESVARGDPLPPVRLRERTKARTPDPREREPEPTRG
jgi:conjugative element/phage-associated large polyvalent protein